MLGVKSTGGGMYCDLYRSGNCSSGGVEVKSGADGFIIKMRDGRNLRCVHNSPHGGLLSDYAPHPAIVLKMENGTGLLLPIIVLEMPSVLLMAAVRNVQIARPTLYQVVKRRLTRWVMKSEP
ncbi:Bifunctional nuclease 1 [Trifolium repens]|nr:Bifunctional nuclease 1 [Trifolium repens]